MSSTTTNTTANARTTVTSVATKENVKLTQTRGRILCDGVETNFGDFRDDLNRDGYAIVKRAIPQERAKAYSDIFYSYLEGFGLGYDRNDSATVQRSKLPVINEKGMILHYGVSHEQWVWDIRGEEGVVDAFAKVYDDEDLIVSFDVVNIGFANRADLPANKPWPHQDQDPERHGFRCLQGLVNLNPCGPKDGGLIVCRGGHKFSEEFHKDMANETRIPAWTPEWYGYTERGMKWLADKGLEWVKVCAEPGDLIVWDSRVPHYNVPTQTSQDRMCVYTCFMPAADATQEDLLRKKKAFEDRVGTTHWPNARHTGSNVATRDGVLDPHNRDGPLKAPLLAGRVFKLTGIPYIKAQV